MITLKEWMEIVNYRITEGSKFTWNCFGGNAYCLDSWNGNPDGNGLCIIFDTATQEVYEVQAHDYKNNRAYRMINPDFESKYLEEEQQNDFLTQCDNQAWDDVKYVNLDVAADFKEKALAIIAEVDYDTRIQVEIDLGCDEIFKLMTMAHERDITLNEVVVKLLKQVIESKKSIKTDKILDHFEYPEDPYYNPQ
jgi:hypothetical protein